LNFRFAATGVGSVPWIDVEDTCRFILEQLPDMPFWPQFVNLSPLEDMICQFSEGLPGIRTRSEGHEVFLSSRGLENEMAEFYEKFLAGDLESFALKPDRARGLHALLEIMGKSPGTGQGFIKGQSVGPITFASSVLMEDGRYILHDPSLLDTVIKGLSMKLLWQAGALAGTGRRPVLFIDEPALSGIGSAFSSMDRHTVINALREMIDHCRKGSDALIGIHCCANTDWPAVYEAGPDIINFDAFDFMDSFLIYPDEAARFLEGGGTLAWGIVPTTRFDHETTVDSLEDLLENGLARLAQTGLDRDDLGSRSMLTSACGMGGMSGQYAEQALRVLSELERRMR
jgi:hypothetical protein